MQAKQLYDLQQTDAELASAEEELAGVRSRLSDESAVLSARSELEEITDRLTDLMAKRRAADGTVTDLQSKTTNLESKLYSGSIKNPERGRSGRRGAAVYGQPAGAGGREITGPDGESRRDGDCPGIRGSPNSNASRRLDRWRESSSRSPRNDWKPKSPSSKKKEATSSLIFARTWLPSTIPYGRPKRARPLPRWSGVCVRVAA